uniref:hypothetical protein n=1 Tax=Yoonia sp. TaxID=2212373 RepID=UPI004047BAFB
MNHEERNAWGAVIASTITFLYFGGRIWGATVAGIYATDDGLRLWAWDVLWLMGGGIVITIVVMIAFQILYAIATNTPNPSFITDERDTMISRRGVQVTLVVASTGFILAVIMLARGWGAVGALNTILVGMAAGAVAGDLYKIAVYRFGH